MTSVFKGLAANIKYARDHARLYVQTGDPRYEYADQSLKNARVVQKITRLVRHDETDEEILCGAHVRFNDNGMLFERLKSLGYFEGKMRDSSHYKDAKAALGLTIKDTVDASICAPPIFNETVFGEYTDNLGVKHTWFQMEARSHHRNPVHQTNIFYQTLDLLMVGVGKVIGDGLSLEKFLHYMCYLDYAFIRAEHLNVGPYGYSHHTEGNNPIIKDLSKSDIDELFKSLSK